MDDNIHNLRDALLWLERRISEEAELDGEMTNAHAIQLGFITNMLEKFPLRQCDVGTADEQRERFERFCLHEFCNKKCPCYGRGDRCELLWAQMPYEAQEGGAE